MDKKEFKVMDYKKQLDTYGGWAWIPGVISLFLETIMTSVLAYKILDSNAGSAKYSGKDIKWDSKKSSTSKTTTHVFYVF